MDSPHTYVIFGNVFPEVLSSIIIYTHLHATICYVTVL